MTKLAMKLAIVFLALLANAEGEPDHHVRRNLGMDKGTIKSNAEGLKGPKVSKDTTSKGPHGKIHPKDSKGTKSKGPKDTTSKGPKGEPDDPDEEEEDPDDPDDDKGLSNQQYNPKWVEQQAVGRRNEEQRQALRSCARWAVGLEHESMLVHRSEDGLEEYVIDSGKILRSMATYGRVHGLSREMHAVAVNAYHTGAGKYD
jgi:hypothetical protein